jgi:hypothetical protein
VMRRERCVAASAFRGLLVVLTLLLLGRPESCTSDAWGRELNKEVRSARGEGRGGSAVDGGMTDRT